MPGTRKLGRDTASRTAMLRAMVTFLLENGKIETTVTRAKEVRGFCNQRRCNPQAVYGNCPQVCRPQRRLYPHYQAGAAPR